MSSASFCPVKWLKTFIAQPAAFQLVFEKDFGRITCSLSLLETSASLPHFLIPSLLLPPSLSESSLPPSLKNVEEPVIHMHAWLLHGGFHVAVAASDSWVKSLLAFNQNYSLTKITICGQKCD